MALPDVEGATAWYDTDYDGAARRRARGPRRRARPVRHPRRGDRRGRPRRRRRREGAVARALGRGDPGRPGAGARRHGAVAAAAAAGPRHAAAPADPHRRSGAVPAGRTRRCRRRGRHRTPSRASPTRPSSPATSSWAGCWPRSEAVRRVGCPCRDAGGRGESGYDRVESLRSWERGISWTLPVLPSDVLRWSSAMVPACARSGLPTALGRSPRDWRPICATAAQPTSAPQQKVTTQ